MALIFKIAWRNILRHRSKSLAMGFILFTGAYLLTLGNSVISGMEKGLDANIVAGFTGDVILVSDKQKDDNVLLGISGESLEKLARFDTLRPRLESTGLFGKMVPVGKDFATVINEEGGSAGTASLLGVDFKEWLDMFPGSMEFVKGVPPESSGLILPTGAVNQLYSAMGIAYWPGSVPLDSSILTGDAEEAYPRLRIRNDVVFMGFNEANTSSDIRLKVDALAKFRALNGIWGNFIFVDIDSFRKCMGLFTSHENSIAIGAQNLALLSHSEGSLDSIFGDNAFFENIEAEPAAVRPKIAVEAHVGAREAGVYNLVLARFVAGMDREEAMDSLRSFLSAHHLPLRALTWQQAAGSIGTMSMIFKLGLNAFAAFIFLVAVIIIVNTLSMAVMERVPEIGMMRAVGAQKALISKILFGEVCILSIGFGSIGLGIGLASTFVLRSMGLQAENEVLQLLCGGDAFRPVLGIGDIVTTFVQLGAVAILASLYPLRVVHSISPLDAVSRD